MRKNSNACVYLVGVGPGNEQLITVAAIDCIRAADVIVYDRLISESLLKYKKVNAKLIYVGKSPTKHIVPQEKINKVLVKYAKKGKVVARLKGGDPFLFGRGSEEALELAKEKIPFSIIPGVNSGFAAAAYAGIPLTHRGVSSSVIFVTGHEDPCKKDSSVDWSFLAKHKGTLVIFMGMSRIKEIIGLLRQNGMHSNSPVCIVHKGTISEQKTVVGNLENIVQKVKQEKILNPALIIIGEVVRFRNKINWFEKNPLFGKKILVTRQQNLAATFRRKLDCLGAQTQAYPLIEVVNNNKISSASFMKNLEQADWTVFTSRNAVEICFDLLKKSKKDARSLSGSKIAVLGSGTNEELAKRGICADLIPEKFVMEDLLRFFKKINLKGKRVFFPHSKQGRPVLTQGLKKQGAIIDEFFIYEVQLPERATAKSLKLVIKDFSPNIITFTSSSCVHNFMKLLSKQKQLLKKQCFAVIGPITKKTLESYGYKAGIIAKVFTIDGFVEAIKKGMK